MTMTVPAEVRTVRTNGLFSDYGSDQIPASHRDLVECPPVAALTTVMSSGHPQTSVVWCDSTAGACAVQHDAWLFQGAEHAPRSARHAPLLRPLYQL